MTPVSGTTTSLETRLVPLLNEEVQVTDLHGNPTFRGTLIGFCMQPTLIIEDASGHRSTVAFSTVADVQAVTP